MDMKLVKLGAGNSVVIQMEGGIWEAEGHKIREAGERDSGSGTSHLCY